MKYKVHMIDVPIGSAPTIELPDSAVIIGPWQNPGAKSLGIIYLQVVVEEQEKEPDDEP